MVVAITDMAILESVETCTSYCLEITVKAHNQFAGSLTEGAAYHGK